MDGSGNAYVTGYADSPGTGVVSFPTAGSPFQASQASIASDAFVTKLNASGSALIYSTYLGGSGSDYGTGIAVDGSGNAYVTGYTASTNFPTQSPYQASYGGGAYDAFVTKVNASGSALTYSTYLGGSGHDAGAGIAVDNAGNAYVTGYTSSTNFPTQSPYQASLNVGYDAFVTKLAPGAPSGAPDLQIAGKIAFSYANDIFIMNADGSNQTNLTLSSPLRPLARR